MFRAYSRKKTENQNALHSITIFEAKMIGLIFHFSRSHGFNGHQILNGKQDLILLHPIKNELKHIVNYVIIFSFIFFTSFDLNI